MQSLPSHAWLILQCFLWALAKPLDKTTVVWKVGRHARDTMVVETSEVLAAGVGGNTKCAAAVFQCSGKIGGLLHFQVHAERCS